MIPYNHTKGNRMIFTLENSVTGGNAETQEGRTKTVNLNEYKITAMFSVV